MIVQRQPVQALTNFRELVEQRLGLHFDPSREAFLEEVLRRRCSSTGFTPTEYLGRLSDEGLLRRELRCLASELTVPETYFFRHLEQFRAFMDVVVASGGKRRAGKRPLRVLSAACATGEEAYTLAILLSEWQDQTGQAFEVYAMDLNAKVLEHASRGRYNAWALRETGQQIRDRWFRREDKTFTLLPRIRSAVTFVEGNLISPDAPVWREDFYDAVFCRNVLMYFPRDHARRVVERIATSLRPDGHLFLGSAETLRGISADFQLRQTHSAFYYQRTQEPVSGASAEGEALPPRSVRQAPAVIAPSSAWFEEIRRSSERVLGLQGGEDGRRTELEQAPPERPVLPARTAASAPIGDGAAPILALMEEERFDEALTLTSEACAHSKEPLLLLLNAMLLCHQGQREAAEAACELLLASDPFDAAAHHILALCREAAGDPKGASEHDRYALHLDPTFAIPRLRLGIAARRRGAVDEARRELAQTLLLLEAESPSRLLLFGGGFSRDALIALCRSELRACGGRA